MIDDTRGCLLEDTQQKFFAWVFWEMGWSEGFYVYLVPKQKVFGFFGLKRL